MSAWYEKGHGLVCLELKKRKREFRGNAIQGGVQLLSVDGRLLTHQQVEQLLADEIENEN